MSDSASFSDVFGPFYAIIATYALVLLAGVVICTIAGYLLLDRVDRGGAGALLGFCFGPVGVAIAWALSDFARRQQESTAEILAKLEVLAPRPEPLKTPGARVFR